MIKRLNARLKAFVPMLILMVIMFSSTAFAASSVHDDAGLLYDMQVSELQTQIDELSKKTGWDVVVATTADAQGKTAAAYADDYYDSMGGAENGLLYLVDMDNGELYVSTSGEAIKYLSDKRIQSMLEKAIAYAKNGDFYSAVSSEISTTSAIYDAGPANNGTMTAFVTVAAAAVIIGAIAAGIAVASVKKSYGFKDVGNIYEYNTKSKLSLTTNSDRLVNSFVTTRIRPRQPRGGGGFGGSSTHTSSSGRTHGGGGGSFR